MEFLRNGQGGGSGTKDTEPTLTAEQRVDLGDSRVEVGAEKGNELKDEVDDWRPSEVAVEMRRVSGWGHQGRSSPAKMKDGQLTIKFLTSTTTSAFLDCTQWCWSMAGIGSGLDR